MVLLLSLLPLTIFIVDSFLLGLRRRIDILFTIGSVSLLAVLSFTMLTWGAETPFAALQPFENAMLTWASVQALIVVLYRRQISDEVFNSTLVLFDGVVIILSFITLLSTSTSGAIALDPLYIILIFAGYSCTIVAAGHILSNGDYRIGDLFAKGGWALLGAAMIFEVEAIIGSIYTSTLSDLLRAAAFLPWIFLTAYFHSRHLGVWIRRISISLAGIGVFATAVITLSGGTGILFYPSSVLAPVLLLPLLPFATLIARRPQSGQRIKIESNLVSIWLLLIGLGIYLFATTILTFTKLLPINFVQNTTYFYAYLMVGLIASSVILINGIFKSIRIKMLLPAVAVTVFLSAFIGIIEINVITLLAGLVSSAAVVSAVYLRIRRRLRLLSILGFITIIIFAAIQAGNYFNAGTRAVELAGKGVEPLNGVTVEYTGVEFAGLRNVVHLPEREMNVPRQAVLLVKLQITADDSHQAVVIPVTYDILDEAQQRPPIRADTIIINYWFSNIYVSITPDDAMSRWLRGAYQAGLIGEGFNAPLNTVEVNVKQVSFGSVFIVSLAALVIVGAYLLPYSTESDLETPRTASKEAVGHLMIRVSR